MLGKHSLLVLVYLFFILAVAFAAKAELKEYADVKKIISRFDSTNSEPANIFSVYFNEDESGLKSRYQFFKDLNNNQQNLRNFGDFPYKPTGTINQEEYKSIEDKAIENRKIVIDQFSNIEKALKYLNDIFSRYQYMTADDKREQSTTVYKYILGETVLPYESLPSKLPELINSDCMSWLDSELHLLSYQYENNDPSDPTDFEDYSRINLTQCLNYLAAGYSMVVSAYKANGDEEKANSFYEQFSVRTNELIDNHEASIKKKTIRSARKAAMYESEDGAFSISKVVSFIVVVSQLLIIILFP